MTWLLSLVTAFFKALLPWLASQSRPSAEDADPDVETRRKLTKRVREHWPKVVFVSAVLVLGGCGGGAPFTRTIYVPDGTPVRLRETVRNAKVWVKDAQGEAVPGRMDLMEGWYALSLDQRE